MLKFNRIGALAVLLAAAPGGSAIAAPTMLRASHPFPGGTREVCRQTFLAIRILDALSGSSIPAFRFFREFLSRRDFERWDKMPLITSCVREKWCSAHQQQARYPSSRQSVDKDGPKHG